MGQMDTRCPVVGCTKDTASLPSVPVPRRNMRLNPEEAPSATDLNSSKSQCPNRDRKDKKLFQVEGDPEACQIRRDLSI